MALVLTAAQAALPATDSVVVRATIWPNLRITFTPKEFKHGTVVIKVKNGALRAHQFSINGVTTPSIAPNMIVSAKVTFRRPAVYTATLADCGYLSQCAGHDTPFGNVKVT